MPELNIAKEMVRPDVCLLSVTGFLDAHTFEQMDELIQQLFDDGVYKIACELGGLEYISSAGAGVFIGALAIAQENAGNIVLFNATENVQEVFDLLGLTQIFTMAKSREDALGAF